MSANASHIASVEYTMPYGDEGDDIDLEIYVGLRGSDLEEWVNRLPDVKDMTEMMRTLLIFFIIARSRDDAE